MTDEEYRQWREWLAIMSPAERREMLGRVRLRKIRRNIERIPNYVHLSFTQSLCVFVVLAGVGDGVIAAGRVTVLTLLAIIGSGYALGLVVWVVVAPLRWGVD